MVKWHGSAISACLQIIGQRLKTFKAITPASSLAVNPPLSALPVPLRKPANSGQCLRAGLNLAEHRVFQDKTYATMEPNIKQGPEGMRCQQMLLSQDDALGFLPFHAGHQAEFILGEYHMFR